MSENTYEQHSKAAGLNAAVARFALSRRTPGTRLPGIFLAVAMLAGAQPASAIHPNPHPTNAAGIVEFNVYDSTLFGGAGGALPGFNYFGGPCAFGSVAGGSIWACWFVDSVVSVNDWSWETTIHNTGGQFLNVPVGFFYPGGPTLGFLSLGQDSAFHIQIPVEDALFGEAGLRRIWYFWRHPNTIHVDAAVIETGANAPINWHFHTDPADDFVVDNAIDPATLAFSFNDPTFEAWVDDNLDPIPLPGSIVLFLSAIGLLRFRCRPKAS